MYVCVGVCPVQVCALMCLFAYVPVSVCCVGQPAAAARPAYEVVAVKRWGVGGTGRREGGGDAGRKSLKTSLLL